MTTSEAIPVQALEPAGRAGGGFQPARLLDVELTAALPALRSDGQRHRAWVTGRLHSEPVGTCVLELGDGELHPDELGGLLWEAFRAPVVERFEAAGLPAPGRL